MTNSIADKRKFLVVTPEKEIAESLQESVLNNFSKVQIYSAGNGAEAQSKISNDPPHVVFIDSNIKKVTAYRFVEWILDNPRFEGMALIVLSEIPDREQFVDEVLVGKVQYLEDYHNQGTVLKFINRALNYVASGDDAEFNIKFISPGEELLHEGDIGDTVYIVKSGELEATHMTTDGNLCVLGKIEAGEFVGEMSFVNSKPRSASVRAVSQCELIEIPMTRMDHLLFRKPAWSKALVSTLTKRLEQTNAILKAKESKAS